VAETKDTTYGGSLTPLRNNSGFIYVRADAVADTFSVIKATPSEYQNNGGTVMFQVVDASKLKTSNTIPTANRGSTFDHNLIIQSGGTQAIDLGVGLGIQALGNKRLEIINSGGGSGTDVTDPSKRVPPLVDGSLLKSNNKQDIQETLASAFSANLGPRQFTEPNTRTTLIGGSTVLRYPLSLDTSVQDYLQIAIFGYKPGGIPGIRQGTDQGRFARQRLEAAREVIQVPIPNAIADQNAVNWGAGEMTSTAGEASQAVVGALMGNKSSEGLANTLESAGDLLGSLARAGQTALSEGFIRRRLIANRIAQGLSGLGVNIDVNQAITRLGGVVENPNLELLFTGPSLRTFQFTIRFTPRSVDESKRVRTIIRVLKERSAVKKGVQLEGLSDPGSSNLLLGTPDVFRLEYKQAGAKGTGPGQNIRGVNKFKTCALTNVSVDYTGEAGRWASYAADSQPVTTLVTLSFSELVPLYDEDYKTGFPDDDVAF
jgi:hypothetical protein